MSFYFYEHPVRYHRPPTPPRYSEDTEFHGPGPRHEMPDRLKVKGFHPTQWLHAPDHWKRTGWLTYHDQPIYHDDHGNYAVEYTTKDPNPYHGMLPPPDAVIGYDKWVKDIERWKSTGWQLDGQTIYYNYQVPTRYAVYGEGSKHDGGRRRTRKRNFRRNKNKNRVARRSSQRHYRCASSRR